ncbi:MAG: hypothetical protein IKZ58_02715 [Selenomonadaceae bacterium]|nr:hypothetical protein [Selenomonadaceae bacterium]
MEVKIFSAIVTGMVETALNKLENQIANYIREKQVVSVNQSIIPASSPNEKTRIVITVVTK